MPETPNGPFPNYREERVETERQYLDRIFGEWLAWVERSERMVRDEVRN